MFLGVPGLKVVAPNTLGNPGDLLLAAIADDDPVLFIEHKLLYTRPLIEAGAGELVDYEIQSSGQPYTNFLLHIKGISPRLTIATYGYNFELVRQAVHTLMMDYEIFCDIALFSQLSPFDLSLAFDSLAKTRKLLTVEEGGLTLGWGAELVARSVEKVAGLSAQRVAARDLPIANSRSLEDVILPSVNNIVDAAVSLVN